MDFRCRRAEVEAEGEPEGAAEVEGAVVVELESFPALIAEMGFTLSGTELW